MFETDDIQAFYEHIHGRGVGCIGHIRKEEYGYLLTLEDPDGHWFEVYQGVSFL